MVRDAVKLATDSVVFRTFSVDGEGLSGRGAGTGLVGKVVCGDMRRLAPVLARWALAQAQMGREGKRVSSSRVSHTKGTKPHSY